MTAFTVNGVRREAETDKKLMDYLRDDLRLTSVKNGCSEGACGTCTVLIDGKAKKSCVQRVSKLEGASIITAEGLSEREKQVFSYAFAKAGAVQCGFCTPGMVMCAKALIDEVGAPTRDQAKKAIRGNICRCTGYKKIVDGIILAADLLGSGAEIPSESADGSLGERMLREDAAEKVLGKTKYTDDIYLDGMLYGSALRSAYPRARVLSIDTAEARALAGVAGVFTAADIPGNVKIGHIKKDWDALIPVGTITHYLGDAIALVAAETPELAERAKLLINVEYEPLPPVACPADALKPDAPLVHRDGNILSTEHLKRGDADAAIKSAKYSVTRKYKTPFTEHAFLEPECAVALPDGEGVRVFSADQGIYQTRRECSELLGIPAENVRVTAMTVGGGFGGKEDMSVQHHAALLAFLLKRPVKVRLTRAESLLVHPKRHAMELEFTTACDENGVLTALRATIVSDTGAYASLGGPVLQRACTHAAGPYNFQNVDITGTAVYTNNPPAGAFRGFGVTQSNFAAECNLDLLAEMVGISPFEIRRKNAIKPGETLPNGQIASPDTAIIETLEAIRPFYEKNPRAGIACAIKNSGLGVGIPDIGRCTLAVEDRIVHIRSSAACIGQGLGTILIQLVCQTAALAPEFVVHDRPDTLYAPDCGNTTASRQTLFAGEAARQASLKLKAALNDKALSELNGMEYYGEYFGKTDKMGADVPNPVSHVAYGYATHMVEMDENGEITRVYAAHDVGKAVNPVNIEGQIEGGVVMSLGYALSEKYELENCVPRSRYGTLGLFKADKTPEVVPIIVERSQSEIACGAKGIGEIASIPTPAAVALAYYHLTGKFSTELPIKRD